MNTHIKTILFYQHFGNESVFRGAHYKTLDYYNHIKSYVGYEPVIAFDSQSAWGPGIPWFHMFDDMPTLDSIHAKVDILFLNSGKDWLKYQAVRPIPENMPIISPVNHFRALNPEHKSFKLLNQKATRLCPSPELYRAVMNHELTKGQVTYLPNAIEKAYHGEMDWEHKPTEILVVGNKNSEMAAALYAKLQAAYGDVKVIDEWISKKEFQRELANSKLTVHLPKAVEAHYIPAIEAMMYGSLVIVPDCVGNRSYARHEETCLMPEYNLAAILEAVQSAFSLDHYRREMMIQKGHQVAQSFSTTNERNGLLAVLQSTQV